MVAKKSKDALVTKRNIFGSAPETVSDADLDTLIMVMSARTSFDPFVGPLN